MKTLALSKIYIYIHYTYIRNPFSGQKGYKEATCKTEKVDIHHIRMAK